MGEHGGTKQGGTMQDDNDTRTEQLSLRRGNEGPTSRSGEKRGVSSDSSETTSLTPLVDPSILLKTHDSYQGIPSAMPHVPQNQCPASAAAERQPTCK